ncbi:putative metalloprotease CJM1_0395 family protein [Shewanella sp. GXUN23E]|uniref:putative metalloprotease CJM1_0395 family protein n=1 Tax=Shewanella sp. GXUN23E TaxID=3422498 RepID=UPI003D7C63B8
MTDVSLIPAVKGYAGAITSVNRAGSASRSVSPVSSVTPASGSSSATSTTSAGVSGSSDVAVMQGSYRLGAGASSISGIRAGQIAKSSASQQSYVPAGVRLSSQTDISGQFSPSLASQSIDDVSIHYLPLGQSSGMANPSLSDLISSPAGMAGDSSSHSDELNTAFNDKTADRQQQRAIAPEVRDDSAAQAGQAAAVPLQKAEPKEEDKASEESNHSVIDMGVAEQELVQLQQRHMEVTSHEQAHVTVGGHYAQSPSYRYETGSDGKKYAVDGEVQIDISEVPDDPQATLIKMQKVYAAAMAPVDPSIADIRVATEALKKINVAKQQLAQERQQAIADLDTQQTLAEAAQLIEGTAKFEPQSAQIGNQLDEQGNITRTQTTDTAVTIAPPDAINSGSNDSAADSTAGGVAAPVATLQSGSKEWSELVTMAIEKRYGIKRPKHLDLV